MQAKRTDIEDHLHSQTMVAKKHELIFARIKTEMIEHTNAALVAVAAAVVAGVLKGTVSGTVLSNDTSPG